jgi:predicted DNA-binding protein
VRDENGRNLPTTWLLGIAAALIAGGIVTSISFSISVSRELGTISARLANLESGTSLPMANATKERIETLVQQLEKLSYETAATHKEIREWISLELSRDTAVAERLSRIEERLKLHAK